MMSYKQMFACKTPYSWTQNPEEARENEFSVALYNGHKCNVKGVNMIVRHGARYPNINWLKKMEKIHERLKDTASVTETYPFIHDWKMPCGDDEQARLNALGETEMKELGKRFGKRFRELLYENIDMVKYSVTNKERTYQSFQHFKMGISKIISESDKKPNADVEDTRLRFNDDGSSSEEYLNEVNDFKNGTEMQRAIQNLNERLGIQLDTEEIYVMRRICALELGLHNKSQWFQLLNEEVLQYMDYMDDLQKYLRYGYGQTDIWKLTLPFTSHLFKRFDEAVDDQGFPAIDIAFSHSETLLPIFTAFELFKDEHSLTSSSFRKHENRNFRTSKISPYSANMAIAIYKCDITSEFVVKMFVNEKAVTIPRCEKVVCSYDDFKNEYKYLIKQRPCG